MGEVLAVMKDVNADGGGHAVGFMSLDAIADVARPQRSLRFISRPRGEYQRKRADGAIRETSDITLCAGTDRTDLG